MFFVKERLSHICFNCKHDIHNEWHGTNSQRWREAMCANSMLTHKKKRILILFHAKHKTKETPHFILAKNFDYEIPKCMEPGPCKWKRALSRECKRFCGFRLCLLDETVLKIKSDHSTISVFCLFVCASVVSVDFAVFSLSFSSAYRRRCSYSLSHFYIFANNFGDCHALRILLLRQMKVTTASVEIHYKIRKLDFFLFYALRWTFSENARRYLESVHSIVDNLVKSEWIGHRNVN